MDFCRIILIIALLFSMAECNKNGTTTPGVTKGWGTAVIINSTDNVNFGDAELPQVVIDSSGNALAVWTQPDMSGQNIYSNRYTASTGLWGTPELIETDDGTTNFPQIAMDPSGNAIAVWIQDIVNHHIYSNYYTASTGHWGTAVAVEDNAGDAFDDPQIAIDPSGNAIAVWNHDQDIYANRYTASTGLWGTAEKIENAAGWGQYPGIALDSAGNGIAVWQQDDGTRYNMYANRYTALTDTWGAIPELIETDNLGWAERGRVAFDGSGNAEAVWYQHDGTQYNIWSNRYTETTGLWGTAEKIEFIDAGNAYFQQISIDPSGNALAVWTQTDGAYYNIYSNRYTESTGLWGAASVLIETDDTGDAEYPQIAMDASGNATVSLAADEHRLCAEYLV